MALGRKLKVFVQRCVKVFGYRIEKLKDTVKAPIDVLELLVTRVSAERPDFFFVQIGANNGLTDDPIRQFVTKYHWRGVLIEPQPQVFQQLLKNYEQEKQLAFENTVEPSSRKGLVTDVPSTEQLMFPLPAEDIGRGTFR